MHLLRPGLNLNSCGYLFGMSFGLGFGPELRVGLIEPGWKQLTGLRTIARCLCKSPDIYCL